MRNRQMVNVREILLKGRHEAVRLHQKFDMCSRIQTEGGRIDVFDTLIRCHVALLFKPLDGLLGAYIDAPEPGVLITTKRPLSVQRFTGAHELGHARLGHGMSLDDSLMLQRSPFDQANRYEREEREADAFAVEFMLPPWLFATHFERQAWGPQMMVDPTVVYQLSLRIGASYEATCRSLMRPGVEVIGLSEVTGLLRTRPQDIKKTLLGNYRPPDWWGDVWVLTEKDEGTVIEGSKSDLFVLKLTEHSNAGYLWDFEQFNKTGFAIVKDERTKSKNMGIGGSVERSITTRSAQRQHGELTLVEQRPWMRAIDPLEHFRIRYDLTGPEQGGWSQAERRQYMVA